MGRSGGRKMKVLDEGDSCRPRLPCLPSGAPRNLLAFLPGQVETNELRPEHPRSKGLLVPCGPLMGAP